MMEPPASDFSTKDAGIRPAPSAPIPLADMLAHLEQIGFPCSADRIEDWRTAGLLGPTIAAGVGNQRLVAPLDFARLVVIAALHREFDMQKIPDEDLAFWLGVAGDRGVPSHLVMEAIEVSTERFVGPYMMRILGKRAGGREFLEEPEKAIVEKVSFSITRSIKNALKTGFEYAAETAVSTGLTVFLGQILRPTNYAGAAKSLRVLIKRVGATDEQAEQWAPGLWDFIQEVIAFFVPGDRNALVVAARACVNISPEESGRVARHAFLMYSMLSRVMPELAQYKPYRIMVPMIAGMLLHLRDARFTIELRRRIDNEGDAPLQEGVEMLLQVRALFCERFLGIQTPLPNAQPPEFSIPTGIAEK